MLAYVKAYTKKDTTSEYYDNLSFLKAAALAHGYPWPKFPVLDTIFA